MFDRVGLVVVATHQRRIGWLIGVLGLIVGPRAAHASPSRWPSWVSEVQQSAAPLHEMSPNLHRRRVALTQLEQYPSELIEPFVVMAANSRYDELQRAAFSICLERELLSCIPAAQQTWQSTPSPGHNVLLQLLALQPTEDRLSLLLDALQHTNADIRTSAARALGVARLLPQTRDRVANALVTKVADPSSIVRLRAVEALGLIGSQSGSLAVAQMLADPEPSVRAMAARSIGRRQDVAATPALIRALHAPNEPIVRNAIMESLAVLPGDLAIDTLLDAFDRPPAGMSTSVVASIVGTRPTPEPQLIEGLVARLRNPTVRHDAERTLLMFDTDARPALQALLATGPDPIVTHAIHQLLAASKPHTRHDPPPALFDETSADAVQRGTFEQRWQAAIALGQQAPPWLRDRVIDALERVPLPESLPWVVALMASTERLPDTRLDAWARLAAHALDPTQDPGDRCLTTLALGRGPKSMALELQRLRTDNNATVRMCAAAGLAERGHVEPRWLVDPDPRIRWLGVTLLPITSDGSLPIRMLALTDPDPTVRNAASLRNDQPPASLRVLALANQPLANPGSITIRGDRIAWILGSRAP